MSGADGVEHGSSLALSHEIRHLPCRQFRALAQRLAVVQPQILLEID
jgi:hypothetical protein